MYDEQEEDVEEEEEFHDVGIETEPSDADKIQTTPTARSTTVPTPSLALESQPALTTATEPTAPPVADPTPASEPKTGHPPAPIASSATTPAPEPRRKELDWANIMQSSTNSAEHKELDEIVSKTGTLRLEQLYNNDTKNDTRDLNQEINDIVAVTNKLNINDSLKTDVESNLGDQDAKGEASTETQSVTKSNQADVEVKTDGSDNKETETPSNDESESIKAVEEDETNDFVQEGLISDGYVLNETVDSDEVVVKKELDWNGITEEQQLVVADDTPKEEADLEKDSPKRALDLDENIVKNDQGSDDIDPKKDLVADEDVPKKELDLDEDVKNPQYIPKKGVFYEHDDRSQNTDDVKQSSMTKKENEPVEGTQDQSNNRKNNASQDKSNENRRGSRRQRTEIDRWDHDLYRDEKQKPKSKSELINAYGYDIRHERSARNPDTRSPRGTNNSDRAQVSLDSQRSRLGKDGVKTPRQNQPPNRSREGKPRRQNSRNPRNENAQQGSSTRREGARIVKQDSTVKSEAKEQVETKQNSQPTFTSSFQINRRDPDVGNKDNKSARNDSRGRRRNSRDRPSANAVDDNLTSASSVMPPITTWSNEDMAKAEAFNKEPTQMRNQNFAGNGAQRGRGADNWQTGPVNKPLYHDRPNRNSDHVRQAGQFYSPRPKFQERYDDSNKSNQMMPKNQYGDRIQPANDWHRANNFGSYNAKTNDSVVKTQTFENSALSQQSNLNRSNARDLREVLNERHAQNQQNPQQKVMQSHHEQHVHQRPQLNQQMHRYVPQPQHQHLVHQHQHPQMFQHQTPLSIQQQPSSNQHHSHPRHHQQPQQTSRTSQKLSTTNQTTPQPSPQNTQPIIHGQRETTPQSQLSSHQSQTRPNLAMNNMNDDVQDTTRMATATTNNNDPMNSRPIVKTDTYTSAAVATHQVTQHSQNHRSMTGSIPQQGASPANSRMVPTHLGASGAQAQYYTPSSSRDPSAAILATTYYGHLPPSGHSVIDTQRLYMTPQQLADHGYMHSPAQSGDVAAASVLHQQGMYADATAGGTVASSAYLPQAGSSLSTSTNIPVTGAGPPPMPPASYLQSQYPPPPYTNPYSQPQHNQAPPQSGHAYPYWTYL